MFEKYTEDARKSIFFARYEASHLGGSEIDTEHLLLGILRADRNLARRLFPLRVTEEAVRARVTADRPPAAEKTPTSVDLPVSLTVKRALTYASEESARLNDPHIGPEHLLLGIAQEASCLAGAILREAGVALSKLRPSEPAPPGSVTEEPPKPPSDLFRDLTQAAENGELPPLIGRERELGRIVQILSRRTKNNVFLVGEPGAGKTAIVEGLAQRLAAGVIPDLASRRVLVTDAISLSREPNTRPPAGWHFVGRNPGARETPPPPLPPSRTRLDALVATFTDPGDAVVCIEGLFDMAPTDIDWGPKAFHMLDRFLSRGDRRWIATGTPAGLRRIVENAPALARHFEVINVVAPDPDEAVKILNGSKARYEQFHGVSYSEGTIEMAVYASGRFLAHRALPDRALDLLDEAGSSVKVRREIEPPEIVVIRKRIVQHIRDMEKAIVSHNFPAARQHSEAESADRENIRRLLEERQLAEPSNRTVTPADVEHVVADRIGVPVSTVRTILAQKGPGELEQTIRSLAGAISIDGNEWVSLLAAYLVRSSKEQVEALAKAIRESKT